MCISIYDADKCCKYNMQINNCLTLIFVPCTVSLVFIVAAVTKNLNSGS